MDQVFQPCPETSCRFQWSLQLRCYGKALRLIDQYTHDFFVEPKEKVEFEELEDILLNHPNVLYVIKEDKFTSVSMKEKSSVLHVYVDHAKNFRKVLKDVEKLGLVKAYYNVDILHVQRYLFQRGFSTILFAK